MADNTQNALSTLPDLSKLSFESTPVRRRIIASYWLVILLAIPLWWKTTSIDRLSLPEGRVRSLGSKQLSFPVNVEVAVPTDVRGASPSADDLVRLVDPAVSSYGISARAVKPGTSHDAGPGNYQVILTSGSECSVRGRTLYAGVGDSKVDPMRQTANTLSTLLVPHASRSASEEHRTVKYAPRYRLAFTLLNEDAASGQGVFTWDVREAIDVYLKSSLNRLSILHNFTIESQVQFHAPLAFQPRAITVQEHEAHGLTPEDLTVFVNSAEWTLSSSVSNDPVLHFVLFVPSSSNSPLYILDSQGTPITSDAFILPQWGGIVLLNNPAIHLSSSDLMPAFETFHSQLLSLLGVPNLPDHVRTDEASFTEWQLDALVRQRAIQNFETSKDTLSSIVALVDQIENMPVGQDVKGDVQNALDALEAAFRTAVSSSTTALRHASEALTLASRAFFNPGMLALLYFPAEHKYAVYTPLFASIAAPLFASVLREVAAWRKARKAARTAAHSRAD